MILTRKEIRRRFYLRHKDKVRGWIRQWYEKHKNDPEYKKKMAEYHKKWEIENYQWRRKIKTLQARRKRKKQIKNHKWFCRVHKVWIGEDYYCPHCEFKEKSIFKLKIKETKC